MEDFINESYKVLSDEELVELIKSGKTAPLLVLINRYMPIITAKSKKFCFNGDNDDFIQEGLLALYSATRVFDPQVSSFKVFAGVCIERTLISYLRKNYSKKQIPKEALVYFEDSDEFSDYQTPESVVIDKEESELLAYRIKQGLSEQEYKILILFLEGNSYESIANKFGLTAKAVSSAMYRARKKIELLK